MTKNNERHKKTDKPKKKNKENIVKKLQRVRRGRALRRISGFFGVLLLIGIFIASIFFATWYSGPGDDREVKFSYRSGFYEEDLEVKLSVDGATFLEMAEIRYNLDGDDILHTSTPYNEPIKLRVPESGYRLYTITAAFCYIGEKCSMSNVATYVLGTNLKEDVDLDIININSSFESLYNYETGIMVKGKTYDDNLRENPDTLLIEGNYSQRTEEWIRDAQVTMFDTSGEMLLNRKIGIQISGNTSALADVKSIKLVGNKKYGYTRIPFDFGDGTETYNTIKLSNGGQDHWWGHVRSSLISRLAEQSGFDGYSPTKRVAVFLNGDFYGVFDAQINYSDSNIAKKFDLPNNDFVEKYKSKESIVFADAGIGELFTTDLNDAANRAKLEASVDMDNYLLYYALQILWQNIDWPINNFEMWRYNGEYDSNNKYTDGRWRFLIYDTDCAYYCNEYMEHYAYDYFAELLKGETVESTTFTDVMKSKYYRNRFIAIIKDLINGPFAEDNVLSIIDEEVDKIDLQLGLWYEEKEYNDWKKEVAHLKRLVVGINDMLKADILKYYAIIIY